VQDCQFENDDIDYSQLDVDSFKEGSSLEQTKVKSPKSAKVSRLCPGHEVAVPIEKLVESLDMKEEGMRSLHTLVKPSCIILFSGICTLLCYLELHAKEWLINLTNVYATCRIQCYGGPQQLLAIAKKVSFCSRKAAFGLFL
jgi:ATP-dependent DNA helicase Q4